MDAPCDSGRRVAGGVGWGKRFGVSGMRDGVGGMNVAVWVKTGINLRL